LKLPDITKGWCSGANALYLASLKNYSTIFLLGFDLGSNSDNPNNLYYGTEHYDSHNSYGGNWLAQITSVIRKTPNTKFIRVINHYSKQYEQLHHLTNFDQMTVNDFKIQLRNLPKKV
jgi:hypothetical protein